MTKLILTSFILLLSLIMLLLKNPLSMGLMILLQTLLTCMLSGMFIKTYWFSYILFLTFLGGLLVLFIYVSSIASNELFMPFYNKNFYFFFLMILLLIFILFFMNNLFFMNLSFNSDMNNMFNINNMIYNSYSNSINLNKLYNNHTFMIMLMLMIYLLISLIAIVKITNIFYGPLRSMF
uniref:NADH dehydrogenase subunit 6 n=1 Tax=Laelia coenosa TaxID=1706499 RepID=UPI00226CB280|nr:NADH dehydrogenase subunit 6 [Laelia coenosa]UYX62390.1 NADH dehydrogenase subunit 6 [Laelia coenosa]